MSANIKDMFSALTEEQQAVVLSAYAHQLTMLARDGYEPETEHLSDPLLLRRVNELEHRVTSAILSRLMGDQERYPDDVLIDIVVGEAQGFGAQLRAAFRRAWRLALGAEMEESLPE